MDSADSDTEQKFKDLLADFKNEFNAKYKFLPPQFRDLSYDSTQLDKVLFQVKSAFYLQKLNQL